MWTRGRERGKRAPRVPVTVTRQDSASEPIESVEEVESSGQGVDVSIEASAWEADNLSEGFESWLLLTGNRFVVGGTIAVVAVGVIGLALDSALVDAVPDRQTATMFASGFTAGTLTLLTVTLSINQLILSRVFGSPDELLDKLDGNRTLRNRVREITGLPTVPKDPGRFLTLIGQTISDRADRLDAALSDSGWTPPTDVEAYVDDIGSYGENLANAVEGDDPMIKTLSVVIGTAYAENLDATDAIGNAYGEEFSATVESELDAIDTLLETVAVSRQFFKTLALQQDLAYLSRVLSYLGMVSLVTSLIMASVYLSDGVVVPASLFSAIFLLAIGLAILPLTVFIAYVLRAATIGRQTVTVGPFTPPK